MSAYTDKRDEIKSELSFLDERLRAQLAAAGQAIVESDTTPHEASHDEASHDEASYASLIASDAQIQSRLKELQKMRDRIVEIGNRLTEIKQADDELEKRRKELGAELEPHYEAIGENAFRVYRNNPLVDQEYADIFTPVQEAHEEIKQTRAELDQAESELENRPFLEKMVVRGRIIVLRNRLSLRENQIARLYRDAGRQIAATDFITTIGDPELERAAAPFLEKTEETHRLEDESASLREEREALEGELRTLGVERRPAARLSDIDSLIQTAESERKESLIAVANAVREAMPDADLGDEVRAELESVAAIERDREDARERLERVEAAIQAERLLGEKSQLETTIGRKRSQIEKLQADIEGLEREKAGLESMITAAEQRRGAEADLLES